MARGINLKRVYPKIGRNSPCPCNSGKKFKNCCINGEWVNDMIDTHYKIMRRGDQWADLNKKEDTVPENLEVTEK